MKIAQRLPWNAGGGTCVSSSQGRPSGAGANPALSIDRYADAAGLSTGNPSTRGCWCQHPLLTIRETAQGWVEGNQRRFSELAGCDDPRGGLLAYDGGRAASQPEPDPRLFRDSGGGRCRALRRWSVAGLWRSSPHGGPIFAIQPWLSSGR